jgi:hypothetical protein
MRFKKLLDDWGRQHKPATTRDEYLVRLKLEDAARLHALAELYPDIGAEHLITDLLSAALDELEASMPYVPGERVIREDDYGDPVYEDTGLTPRFLELVRKHRQHLESE